MGERWFLVLAAAAAPVLPACDGTEPPSSVPVNPWPPRMVDYQPVPLTYDSIWYRLVSIQRLDHPQDAAGVAVFPYDGALHYNPVQLAQKGLWFLDNYRRTGEEVYLARSLLHARKLLELADTIDGALYFPYDFDYRLHGLPHALMEAPWYHGMAQGQALSLFLRLYTFLGERDYLEVAHAIFPVFLRLKGGHEPYVARIDDVGYYWIEEYPRHISIYHRVHIDQLKWLYVISEDHYFLERRDELVADSLTM